MDIDLHISHYKVQDQKGTYQVIKLLPQFMKHSNNIHKWYKMFSFWKSSLISKKKVIIN
jgi:hypothetical protein